MERQDKIKAIIEKSIFVDSDIKQPSPIITIQDKVIATSSNFITISGLPKSRKTTFMQFFIAAALNNKSYFGIKAEVTKDEKVILIDTEQSIYDFHKQNKFLKKALGKNTLPKNFSAYLFREFEPDIILESIYNIIEQQKPKIVFIDNLTELAINPNDIAEAKKVIQFLKKVTAKFDCVIVCLLHLSKSSNNTLGNLGSYADRAAQSVLRVTLDKETDSSTLDCSMLRSDAHFEPIAITYDTTEKCYVSMEIEPKEDNKKAKFSMEKFSDAEIKSRIQIIFEMQPEYVYGALVENLQKVFGIGNTRVKQIVVPYLTTRKYIKQNKQGVYINN
jgi:KaiC/GvpD/RAD55 family RecA-like ATPase